MAYHVHFIGTVAIGIEETYGIGSRIMGFTLQEGEKIPEEFHVGD